MYKAGWFYVDESVIIQNLWRKKSGERKRESKRERKREREGEREQEISNIFQTKILHPFQYEVIRRGEVWKGEQYNDTIFQ